MTSKSPKVHTSPTSRCSYLSGRATQESGNLPFPARSRPGAMARPLKRRLEWPLQPHLHRFGLEIWFRLCLSNRERIFTLRKLRVRHRDGPLTCPLPTRVGHCMHDWPPSLDLNLNHPPSLSRALYTSLESSPRVPYAAQPPNADGCFEPTVADPIALFNCLRRLRAHLAACIAPNHLSCGS